MHLPEGILPAAQAAGWAGASGIMLVRAVKEYRKTETKVPELLPMMGILGAAVFVMSMLHIPVPFTGTSAHMVGVPLATLLVGPWLAIILSLVALILQALLLGEGGLGPLGANVFAMGVAGSFATIAVYRSALRVRVPKPAAIFLAALIGDLAVYVVSALQLAPVFPGQTFMAQWAVLILAFLPLQLPVALLEGFITVGIMKYVTQSRPSLVKRLQQVRAE